ncbi:unnamed protein product [Sphagnum jensenii]|uniref:Uncharacterized protein n=1 Tax=Sphagnum jensenii TaxID=128206 RepID=A0ABP1B0W9_9BRYO
MGQQQQEEEEEERVMGVPDRHKRPETTRSGTEKCEDCTSGSQCTSQTRCTCPGKRAARDVCRRRRVRRRPQGDGRVSCWW